MSGQGSCRGGTDKPSGMAIDPVCDMQVDPATAKHVSVREGETFYFCGASCKAKFEVAPNAYLAAPKVPGTAMSCSATKPAAAVTHDHEHAHQHAEHEPAEHDQHVAHTVKDPVCGMTVDPHSTKHHADYAGQTYHFCSVGCREKFIAEPTHYLGERVAAPPAIPGAIYTCPMHPEVQQVGPGACPKCGMALEPMTPTLDDGDSGELSAMTRRFWLLVALTVPVVALAMGPHLFG